MRATVILLVALSPIAVHGQNPSLASESAVISGTVRVEGSGVPFGGAPIRVSCTPLADPKSRQGRVMTTVTDSLGTFQFQGINGDCSLSATEPVTDHGPGFVSSSFRLDPKGRRELNLILPVTGSVSGTVTDDNDDPVRKAWVYLVAQEYFAGSLRYFIRALATTREDGTYVLRGVTPHRRMFVMASLREQQGDSVLPPTFHPNSRDIEGAAGITVISAGLASGIDIHMHRTAGYCVSGVVSINGKPGEGKFEFRPEQPAFGLSLNGGLFIPRSPKTSNSDGSIKTCGVPRGTYVLDVIQMTDKGTDGFGSAGVTVSDRDVDNVRVDALPLRPLNGEVRLMGKPVSEQPFRAGISFSPLYRSRLAGERLSAVPAVPGFFTLPALAGGAYAFMPLGLSDDYFLSGVEYEGNNVLTAPLNATEFRPGSMLRVTIGAGAASVNATVRNSDGDPVEGTFIVWPANASTPGEIAARLRYVRCDADGACHMGGIAPGKYLAIATTSSVDFSPEFIDALGSVRVRAEVLELARARRGD